MINDNFVPRKVIKGLLTSALMMSICMIYAQDEGEKLFQSSCFACHTIGKGRLVGPDLAGIETRRSEAWLLEFVKSSQSMIKKGDPEAVKTFEDYSKMIMPDQPLNDDQVRSVLAYIKSTAEAAPAQGDIAGTTPASDGSTSVPAVVTPAFEASMEDIAAGQNMFQGFTRFENGGPACLSCHHVTSDEVAGGGILAKDLTTVFSTMGAPGVKAIVSNSPFPVMKEAYKDHALTSDEVTALVAFLSHVDSEHASQQARNYGVELFLFGLAGMLVLFGFYSILWRQRKKTTVNSSIFQRQLKSL